MILLDTSIIIDLFRKKDKTKTTFSNLLNYEIDFSISTITVFEIEVGNKQTHKNFWNTLIDEIQIIPFDQEISSNAAIIYNDLRRKNNIIELADLIIASTAVTKNLKLSTLNVKHFERVQNIELFKF